MKKKEHDVQNFKTKFFFQILFNQECKNLKNGGS